jgi:nucleoid-associated protein YgaU
MATVKKGVLTPPGSWARHFRAIAKRAFWKSERAAARKAARAEAGTSAPDRKMK